MDKGFIGSKFYRVDFFADAGWERGALSVRGVAGDGAGVGGAISGDQNLPWARD